MLGPFKNSANGAPDPWQGKNYGGLPGGLGYELEGDIGGPMFLNEAYRWNIPVIHYGFDQSFVDYFGQPGIDAVEQAIAILNALPPASQMSADLAEFPFDAIGQNQLAEVLELIDMKSYALSLLIEQLGLANPERFVWGLRSRNVFGNTTNYAVVRLNYDPVTLASASYVNDVLYNYRILDGWGPVTNRWATASEWFQLNPLRLPYCSVAGALSGADFQLGSSPDELSYWSGGGPRSGIYLTALTRDDVGGLRYLLRRDNKVQEPLVTGVTGVGANTSNFVGVALRGGIDKLTFTRLPLDSLSHQFLVVTNCYADIYYTNDVAVTQSVQRVVRAPDILFRAQDLGGTVYHFSEPELPAAGFFPNRFDRSDTSYWLNNSALNNPANFGGPGVIPPGAVITFSKLGRYFANPGPHWGSFDGSEAYPFVHRGSETNHDSQVLETRLFHTNGVSYLEWTTLLSRDWSSRYFRMEQSVDLTHWESLGVIDSFVGDGPLTVWKLPATNFHRFFRAVKTAPPPE